MANGCTNQSMFNVKTAFGTFRLCATCVTRGHMMAGAKAVAHDADERRPCQCEHVAHFRSVAEEAAMREALNND